MDSVDLGWVDEGQFAKHLAALIVERGGQKPSAITFYVGRMPTPAAIFQQQWRAACSAADLLGIRSMLQIVGSMLKEDNYFQIQWPPPTNAATVEAQTPA